MTADGMVSFPAGKTHSPMKKNIEPPSRHREMTIDEKKLNELATKAVADMGAASSGVLVIIGDRLGLFAAVAEKGPLSSRTLAEITGTKERMVREWLAAMAASEYLTYDPSTECFSMTPEQAALLADPASPFFLASAYPAIAALYRDEPLVSAAFRHDQGVGWHEHDAELFYGTERFFGHVYENFMVPSWLPSLENVLEKLFRGGNIADIGCGHGASTLLMARAFPESSFWGFDAHGESIRRANGLQFFHNDLRSRSHQPGRGRRPRRPGGPVAPG